MPQAEELITTIQAGDQETVQAHVVEEIMQEQIQEEDDVSKDVISQYLPSRKRRPRAKKPAGAVVASTSGNGEWIVTGEEKKTRASV